MKIKIGVIVAVLVIALAAFWGFDSVRQRSYEGSNLTFGVGSGSVVVNNTSDEAIPVEMRSSGRTSNFRVESSDFELNAASTRQGTGRTLFHAVSFDLPAGTSVLNITQGSGVEFISASDTALQATVTPLSSQQTQTTIIAAIVVILAALFYISNAYGHRWIGALRGQKPVGGAAQEMATT